MRRIPIRMKLVGALAVPLSALVIVTTLEVGSAAQEASGIRDQTALAGISLGPTSILSAIEWERNAASVAMLGMEDAFSLPEEDPAKAAVETNEAIETFRAEVDRQDQAIIDAYAPAFVALDGLDELRAVEAGTPDDARGLGNIENVSAVFDDYTAIRDQLVEANRRVAVAIDDPLLRQGADLVDLNSVQTDLVAILVRDLLVATVGGEADGVNTSQEIALVSRNLGHLRSNWATMASTATGPYRPAFDEVLAADEVQRFPEVVDEAVETGVVDVAALTTYAMSEDPETLAYTVFGNEVEDIVLEHARELDAAAQARQRWFMVLAVAAVIVAALAAWLVSRSITRPLRSLTLEAKEMAERRLPDAVLSILETPLGDDVRMPSIEPVTTTTRDEVADVVLALNTVQDTALDLAVEQALLRRNIADSFVNLGRRNQNLLGRQLDFITELESNETDPDSLANLFRLDHLATRMRRNAESLLVLAGIEPPRQWAAPVQLTDVIRAALGEVEDYQRVTVRAVEPATVLGSAAADLAHLIAELVENALVFSPPDVPVDVRGRHRPGSSSRRAGGTAAPGEQRALEPGYTLAIIDSGLGMPANDIAAANRRLAGAESFTIAPSKYLGHYVAGNLAARHQVRVHLDNSPGSGITATVDIPQALLTSDSAAAQADEPHAARAVWPPAPEAHPPPPVPPTPLPPSQTRVPANALRASRVPPGATLPAHAPGLAADTVGSSSWPEPAAPRADESPAPVGGPARRTSSGLVKRTPRIIDTGEVRAVGLPTDDDLLDVLGRYAKPPATGQHDPRTDPTPARVPAPATVPASPPRLTPPVTPAPLGAGAGGGPTPTDTDPAGGGVTADGLTRRVRGAQLPTASPLSIRRGRASADGDPAPAGTDAPRPRPGPVSPDDSIFTFLSTFTAGVQRGLDTQRDGEVEPPRK